MGIRLNMAMGYGLYPLNFMSKEHMEESLHFDRLEDPDLLDAIKLDLENASVDKDYPLFSTMDKLAFHPNMDPAKDVYEMVRYDPEFGLDDFVLLIPSGHLKNWNRYADLMDIYLMENVIAPDDYEPKVYPINSTLYPYAILMKADPTVPRGYSFYWENCWRDKEDFKDAVPACPEHLWFVLKHVFCQDDATTTAMFLSLRPSIYKSYG